MIIDTLHPFTAAVKANDVRAILPTDLTSAELRTVDAAVRRQSFYSAQTLLEDLLGRYKKDIASIINPTTEQRADRVTATDTQGNVTKGMNTATGAASFSITNGGFLITFGTAAQSNVLSQPFPIWRDRGVNLHVGMWGAGASTANVGFILQMATPQKLGGTLVTNWTSAGITNFVSLNGTTEVYATVNIPKTTIDNDALARLWAITNASGVNVFIDPTNTFTTVIP